VGRIGCMAVGSGLMQVSIPDMPVRGIAPVEEPGMGGQAEEPGVGEQVVAADLALTLVGARSTFPVVAVRADYIHAERLVRLALPH